MRDPNAPTREERIQTRRDDNEIVSIKKKLKRLEGKLVVILCLYGSGEFIDALVGMPEAPRPGDYITIPDEGHVAPREVDQPRMTGAVVQMVTWATVPRHGWQPVCFVTPARSPDFKIPGDL